MEIEEKDPRLSPGLTAALDIIVDRREDIITVPAGEMHGAVNVSDDDGWLMTINAGNQGAEIHWAPDLVDEVRRAGIAAEASETPASGKK